jgi:probable F420-dependent oxidoreductase
MDFHHWTLSVPWRSGFAPARTCCFMQIDLAYTGPISGVEQAAREAELGGFDGLWTSETRHDPFLTLALATRASPSLEIGTGIAVALARSPYTVAQSAWDLATLSGGRFRLGLGSQVKAHVTRRFSMPWHKPVPQMREFIQAVRAIWHSFQTGERLRFEGEYYQHSLLIPNFNPGPRKEGKIPIGLAAVGPLMTRLAGEVADFVILHPFTNVDYLKTVTRPALDKGLAISDRTIDELEVVGSLFAFAEGPEAEQHEATVRQKVAFYGSTPAYRGVLDALGAQGLFGRLHEMSKKGEWKRMSELIDEPLLDHFRVRAPQEELFDKVRERFAGLYDRVVLTVPGL